MVFIELKPSIKELAFIGSQKGKPVEWNSTERMVLNGSLASGFKTQWSI